MTPSETVPEVTPEPASVPRQRWRLVLARGAVPGGPAGRELTDAWETAIERTGLPLHRPTGRNRARIAFGAPVPASMALEHELADILLTELVPSWRVREALASGLPEGWQLIDLYDVWLGAPALSSQVAAADYVVDVGDADAEAVSAAVTGLLAASRLTRERSKGGAMVPYDLRPLVAHVTVADVGPPLVIGMRTRFHPVLGTGRPEEVVAALGDLAGAPLEVRSVVRARLILADELEAGSTRSG